MFEARDIGVSMRIFRAADDVVGVVVARWRYAIVDGHCIRQDKFQPMRTGLVHAEYRTVAVAHPQDGVIAEPMT